MYSKLFNLNGNDLFKGAVTAVLAAIITVLYGVVSQAGFNVFEADWGVILTNVIQGALTAFIAYIGKNVLSDEDGDFLGIK